MKTDTWAIIGAFSGWSAVILTVMLALHSATNARISEQSARIDEQGARLGARIDEQGARLGARIDEQGARLDARIDEQDARIDMLHDTMRNEHALILDSLARIAQRVSYIEGHLGIGRTADTEPSNSP
ncbi:MAG: hypothetical protein F4053_03380 [Proteobacteria bacterium]|nr:hypothetical protein [Pseudomonadota bacterium]MYJ94651.1 hypothetical protein [Pseudomonadota bacterium]